MKIFIVFISILMLCFSNSCSQEKQNKLMIAAAANVQYAIKDLVKSFEEETGLKSQIIVGSSGKLTAQIKEGAPFDVFLSADMKYPDELFNSRMTIDKPKVYAKGKLIIWTFKENIEPSFEFLKSDLINHIAVANPKTAPYGNAAIKVLKNAGIYEDIKSKLVYGESVSQTNQFIISKTADIGFTALSVVHSNAVKEKGKWQEVDSQYYSLISQGAVVIKRETQGIEKAKMFYDFLFSEKAKNILLSFGYEIDF